MKMLKTLIVSALIATIMSVFYYGSFVIEHPNKISEHKQAIIMVPGFLASSLIDEKNIYWDPINTIRSSEMRLFDRVNAITLDEDGCSNISMYAPTMKNDIDLVGGAMNVSYDWFYDVKSKYEDIYDVMMFQYDWRKPTKLAAEQLDEFIKVNKWEKVIFLAHSMGGVVVSNYLTLGKEQQDKVKLMVSFGTPYLGLVELVGLLETGYFPFADDSMVELVKPLLKKFAGNMPGLFEMLPSRKLLESNYYAYEHEGMSSFLEIETENGWSYIDNWQSVVEFFESRHWAKYKEKEGRIGEIKDILKNALQQQEKFFYTENGIEKHITEKVNSYYFAGAAAKVSTAMRFDIEGKPERVESKEAIHDNTVSMSSALINHMPDFERYFLFEGYDHLALVYRNTEEASPMNKFYSLVEGV